MRSNGKRNQQIERMQRRPDERTNATKNENHRRAPFKMEANGYKSWRTEQKPRRHRRPPVFLFCFVFFCLFIYLFIYFGGKKTERGPKKGGKERGMERRKMEDEEREREREKDKKEGKKRDHYHFNGLKT